MKYQLFAYADATRAAGTGIVVRQQMYRLDGLVRGHASRSQLVGKSVQALLQDWSGAHALLAHLARDIGETPERFASHLLPQEGLVFLPPVADPGAIYAAGANYRDHVDAMSRAFNMRLVLDPKKEGVPPWHFLKAGKGTLVGHAAVVPFPGHTEKLDWEAELAVIIGRRASRVSVEEALDYVAGYSCANDLSARDNLRRDQVDASSPFRFDWIGHKCFTGSCPVGPFLTPAAYIVSPENLGIRLWVNGEIKQDSNTSNHLYNVAEQLSYLSHRLDLYPGDILLTGTPAGVGMESGTFLKRGDMMKVWIEGVGELETTLS